MIQTKVTSPQALVAESEQTIQFLSTISEELKQQRRHFDDAVIVHCIRLINDYVDEKSHESSALGTPSSRGDVNDNEGRS